MKRAPNLDKNHKEIVAYLEKLGYSVLSLASMGAGCPDIIISTKEEMWFAEIKDGKKAKTTADQKSFYRRWKGKPVIFLRSKEDVRAFDIMLGMRL